MTDGRAAESRRSNAELAADWTWALARRIHLGTRKPSNWLQLFKFGVVGASGYVVNLLVFALAAEAGGLHHILAAVCAFCVAVLNNFWWNRHWTFRVRPGPDGPMPGAPAMRMHMQAARFFAVSVVALGVNLAILQLLVSAVGLAEVPAQAIAVAVAMPVNFIGNKLWTFL